MKTQLFAAKTVRNQAFGYGYGAGLECLKFFMVTNSQTDLTFLNLEDLKHDPLSRQKLIA